jgi:hypothetical protein
MVCRNGTSKSTAAVMYLFITELTNQMNSYFLGISAFT